MVWLPFHLAIHSADNVADSLIDKSNLALTLSDAESRDVRSLRNWVDGNGCLAGNETSYLEHDCDLVSLVPTIDNAVKGFESWIEEKLVQFLPKFREVCQRPLHTRDPY
jgi:hypothetical protein